MQENRKIQIIFLWKFIPLERKHPWEEARKVPGLLVGLKEKELRKLKYWSFSTLNSIVITSIYICSFINNLVSLLSSIFLPFSFIWSFKFFNSYKSSMFYFSHATVSNRIEQSNQIRSKCENIPLNMCKCKLYTFT